uniref:McrC family protein n=1 Tax=Herbidospora sakaeratensis TaxID=564415 RepID=UPI00078200E7|nr:restriction endonuclease [Herbidospora sakaeratensis]
MTPIELRERGPARSVALPAAVGQALAASGLVEATPDPWHPGQWRLKARRKIGAATVIAPDGQTIALHIAPKLPISRLLFLLGYSLDPKGWRADEVQLGEATDLLPVLARLFARQADTALRQGLLQGYRATDETALVVRGRIREAEQIRRYHGRMIPLEIAHDEYTTDIVENRLLRTTVERLRRLPGVDHDVRGGLLRLRLRLGDVTPIGRGQRLPAWRPSRLNARYHHALRLAELLLRGSSVDHLPGEFTVSGFLFDMAKVFEDFVTTALREISTGPCVLQAGHHLDEGGAIRIIPDFVRYTEDGTPAVVADAKYKAEKPDGFPDADLYQMLAYCTALNLSDGHLVYAKGEAEHTAHRVRHAGITIHQHALDLARPPDALLDEIGALALKLGI